MDKIIALAKQRGFIYSGSEIYGGLANAWDYGPLGAQLRHNIKQLWWRRVVEQRSDMVGFDGAILMNPKVWEASGHVATFHDPLVECRNCHRRYRSDEVTGDCPACAGTVTPPRNFNLMFQTTVGPVAGQGNTVYLRPETAQAMFINFKNVQTSLRLNLPFGMAQIGKAFRNEITPGNYIFRTLEFEQMEIEYFVDPADWKKYFEQWRQWMNQWASDIGLDLQRLHELEVSESERAHYSQRTIDFEFDWPFGRKELWGLAYRTDFDLRNHQQQSGQNLEYMDPRNTHRRFVPHVIEPSLGVDRTVLAVLLSAYREEMVRTEIRVVLGLVPELAPYQIAILPLSHKPELVHVALPLGERLVKQWRCDYDDTQSIGRRYRRQDEIGTPYCVTVDFESLGDQAVTVRERDSMHQERLPMAQLEAYFTSHLQSK